MPAHDENLQHQKILWFTTGGTIDAEPYEGAPPENVKARNPSGIPDNLYRILPHHACEFIEIGHEDSKKVTTAHLDRIVETIEERRDCKEIRISIGTDDLTQCATYIERKMQERGITGKVVVFVAAMEPLANNAPHAWETLRKAATSAGQHDPGFYAIADAESEIKPIAIDDVHLGHRYLQKDLAEKNPQRRTFEYMPSPLR